MHVKLNCEYIGTKFSGFQSQKDKRTVQGELEKALTKYFGTEIKIVGSGRTDAGVHAKGQVISFLLPAVPNEPGKFLYRLASGVNSFLPLDISVNEPKLMEKFNARQEAKSKTYIYKCYVGESRSCTRDETYCQIYKYPDIQKMRVAATQFVGTHDFSAFTTDLGDKSPMRTIYSFDIVQENDEIWFIIRGHSFLKRMVRMLVGKLLGVLTAPAKGLTLQSVEY